VDDDNHDPIRICMSPMDWPWPMVQALARMLWDKVATVMRHLSLVCTAPMASTRAMNTDARESGRASTKTEGRARVLARIRVAPMASMEVVFATPGDRFCGHDGAYGSDGYETPRLRLHHPDGARVDGHYGSSQDYSCGVNSSCGNSDFERPRASVSLPDGNEMSDDGARPRAGLRGPIPDGLYPLVERTKRAYWEFIFLVPDRRFLHLEHKTSTHAASAYCMPCRMTIKFKRGSTYAVSRHVAAFHPNYESTKVAPAQVVPPLVDIHGPYADQPVSKKRPTPLKELTKDQKAVVRRLLALWLASGQRPYSLVEDDGFIALLNYIGSLGGHEISVDKRTTITKHVQVVAEELRATVRARTASDAEFYTITTDIWTDRGMEVLLFPDKHTGELIKDILDKTLTNWGLKNCRSGPSKERRFRYRLSYALEQHV
jgi:hypothetical protein